MAADPDYGVGYNHDVDQATSDFWETTKLVVSEVFPNLWVSGFPGPEVQRQLVLIQPDLVVSLTHAEPPPLPYEVVRFPFTDHVNELDIRSVTDAALTALGMLTAGKTVLVHCMYGLNRSPLVAAQVIAWSTGMDGIDVLRWVQSHRIGSLHNPLYEQYVKGLGKRS